MGSALVGQQHELFDHSFALAGGALFHVDAVAVLVEDQLQDVYKRQAVAKELKGYADELEGAEDFTSAAIALVKRTIRDHRRVIFNGNGYSAEWEEEAARRGLPNKK